MQHTSSGLLEYEDLKALVARYVAGPFGRKELDSLQPTSDREQLESALAVTAEAIEFSRAAGRLPLGGLADVTESVQKLRIEGAQLDGKEIADLTSLLSGVVEVRTALADSDSLYPLLVQRTAALADFRPLLRDVAGKVLPNGLVADDASVALARLRRDIEKQQRHVHQSLEKFLRTHREEGVLQEEYVAIRNDRFVVPIVSGQRRRVDGVIHGASSSGQTLFIEPLETIDLNNELVRLRDEEEREVRRILREITNRLREHAADIRTAVETLGKLDLIFAKASFALDFDCVIPRFSDDASQHLLLREARHPILQSILRPQRKRVVPFTLELDRNRRMLLISGPNTGGKTVTMKTVGLIALMAQSAIPVPASQAKLPIFDQVLADIGDQQSIEQSLSSFSAHISCIRQMVADATRDSLVLLDELGRATDPEEGGALGVAILDHFRESGSITLASTHLLALKVYGANTPTVLNGSMGFDEETLQPTYVLRLGAPGKSAGLDIATRLGLPARLIEKARSNMSTTERDIARFLSELHGRLETATQASQEAERRLTAVTKREADLEREYQRKQASKLRELEQRYDEVVANFEARALDTVENIKELSEQRKAVDQAKLKVAQAKREGRQEMTAAIDSVVPPKQQPQKPKLEEGARVILKGIRQPARVRRIISPEIIEVEAGFMKMQVDADDVQEVLPPQNEPAKLPKYVTFQQASSGPKWAVSYQEINVIGQRADEATDQVERFLDQAALASVDRVRIVHGHGMGVLKKAIGELLARSPHVQKYYPATPSEGGSGATIAELRGIYLEQAAKT
ncbi:MAG TPA: endonuclease MutS2 [Bryobacteraceae bacterium]|nr:endonuclease MutS2 [Bryobacteraceae bacterium]